jgi:hypothetical protein
MCVTSLNSNVALDVTSRTLLRAKVSYSGYITHRVFLRRSNVRRDETMRATVRHRRHRLRRHRARRAVPASLVPRQRDLQVHAAARRLGHHLCRGYGEKEISALNTSTGLVALSVFTELLVVASYGQ